ncbi:MAG: hypothetical protein ACFE7E_04710 [Candidatus Hodarchaeota archaeon]
MTSDEISFKTTLIFWNLYETFLKYNNEEASEVLSNSEFGGSIYDEYYFENFEGERMPLKWIAVTGHYFLPICIELDRDKFVCEAHPEIKGKIQIDAHIYPEGVIVLQARLDFEDYMRIGQLIMASIPTSIILTDGTNMKAKLDAFASRLIDLLRANIKRQKKVLGEKASPWHHTWILWKTKPDVPISDFDVSGRYFKHALGICTRSDKWQFLDPENYASVIEDVDNLSPYEGNCVYITHPGNCVIPSKEFTDPESIKNTLIDVIFATEIGNVQRYLILNHLQEFNSKSLEIQEILYRYEEYEHGELKEISLDDLIDRLENIEREVNELVLEINSDLQITRTPRLIFTSVFKTKLLRQMIRALHGFDFYESLFKIIGEVKDSLSRERDALGIKVSEAENVFLRNLQIVFIIGLVAQMITLFYAVESFALDLGLVFVSISIVLSVLILVALKRLA